MTKQNLIKRFFARFMRARAASAAPAFFFAAAAAGFALAPLDASAAKIDANVETGSFGTDTDQSLAVGSGDITIGGDVSVNVTETTLLTGTQLTISSTSDTLNFGNVTFQQPVADDSITVSGGASVAFDKVAAGTGYGKIDVADGAELVINGDANLSAITAENGELTVKGTATVETLTAKIGATVTLEAADASGVNSLVMAGGTVKVKDFTLDKVDGTNEDNNNASGTISSSGTLTVNPGTTLTTEELNLAAKDGAVIDLKNGSEIDLGTGTVSLDANAQLNIGDAKGAADLTAKSLSAIDGATTTLNGGTLTLNGAGITQNLDSLAESSTGTVSVSGEGATAVFSEDKTFAGALDIAVENGTLQVDAAVSTTGTVSAKNLTIGDADSSVKASAFELSSKGTLTMGGGTLDLSATNGETTDIYAISEGSSGTITEGATAGTIALNKTSTGLGDLDFTAESGTVALTGTAEAPITVETEGDVNARNLVVGANMLVGDNVTVGKATDRTAGDGLTLNGGTLTGTTNVTVNKVVEDDLSGTVDGGTVIFDLDQKDTGTVVAGTLDLGSEATNTNKVWIRGEGLTLGEGSVVTATGDGVNENNGTATGLVVGGGAAGTATVFDLSATGTKLNVNAVNVYSADELKLSGDQKIGIEDNDGKILLGAAAAGEAAGKISTKGTLTSLGQTTMNGGRIESTALSPAPAPEQPEEGVLYPEATIHLGNVAMGNGVISAVDGSVKVAEVRDQGIIAAKDISVGSVSDVATDKVILAGSEDGVTAADKLTFTGTTTASNISANKDSVVNTKALELADGVNVTIGSETNKNILNEENLASVALGGGASLNTTSEDLSALTSVALATGTADDRTTWTHSSGITVNGDVSVGNYAGITAAGAVSVDGDVSVGNDASIDADGAVSVVGSVSVGNRSDITAESINFGDADLKIGGTATLTSETGDVTLGGVLGLEDGVLATATVNSAKDIVFAADSTSSLHLKATGDIVVNENVSVTLSQGEIDAKNTTLKDGSTFELLGNNNVLGGTTGTPEENPYELFEVTLGNDATLVIGGNNPAEETEFYETFAKADSVKNAPEDGVGTIEVNGKLADDETPEDKVSVFTAGTVGDATNGGVNVTLNEGGELVATNADAAGVGIYAAALNGTGGKLTAQAADGTKNDIYVTASNTVGENIAFTADELRVTDLNVSDGADVAVRLENADLGGVNSLVVADAETSADTHTTLTLAGTSSVAAVTVGKDGNNGTLIVESLDEEAPVVVIGDLAEGETANFQTGSLTLDGGALVATDGSIDVRDALAAGTNGLDGTLEAKDVRVDLSAQTETFGANLTLKGETVTLDGNASDFALGAVVDADKLVIGSDAEGETTAVIVADPATTLDGVANEIAVENGDSLFVTEDWTPAQDSLTVTLYTDATLAVSGLSDSATLTVGTGKFFAVNAAVDGEGNVAEPNVAVFDEIDNNGNFLLGNVAANTSSWTDTDDSTLTITGTKTDTEERLASLDISGAADGTTTFNSAVSLTNGALAVAQGNVALNGAISSENGAITAENGSMTVSGGAGTIESLALDAATDITFDTTDFLTDGAVSVVADQGTGNVTFATNVSLGAGSSVAADTLTVNAGAAGTINGTVDVETIALAGESVPDAGDAASLTISGEGDSTFTTLTDAAGTTLSLTNGATLTQNGDATASVSLNGTLSVADANSAFSTPGSLTLANTAELTLANGGAANIAGTLDLSASETGAVTVDGTGKGSDATTTLTAGTLAINPADATNTATQGVVSLTKGGQFTVGELAAGSTVTLTGQNGSGNIWVDETSHFTLKKGDIAITESTRGEIVAESGNVTFDQDPGGNGVYELAGIGTHGLDLSLNSGHDEVNFTMSESLNADGETYTYSKVVVRGMMNLQGTDVSATGAEGRRDFAVSVASGVNLNNAKLTLENVAFSGGESVSLTGSSELRATNTKIEGFDAIITTVGANNSSITLNKATLNTDVTMNSGTLNVGVEGAKIGDGYTVSVNENVSAKLEGNLTGAGKLALNGGNVSLTGDKFTLDNVVVNAANAKISGGETLTIGNLEIGTGDALSVDAALSASGRWNVNGGSLTAGTLTIEGGANVTLENDSTFNGDIVFADGADAELNLIESTVKGNVTLDGENNTLKVTDSSITGTLKATAGSITFNGTNSFGDLRLVSNVNIGGVLDVVGKLEVEGGFELEKDSELSTTEGLFVNGGIATLAGTVTQGDVTLTGTDENSTLSGTIETNLTLNNAQLTQADGGEVVGNTTLANGSTLTQTEDGSLGAVSVDASTFTQNAGTAGAVTLTNGSTLTQTDGSLGAVTLTNGASATLAGTVASLDATNATAEVSGEVSGDMTLTNATANVSGTIETNLTLNNAQLTQTDGKVVGSTTLTNGSKLTQTEDGSLGAVSVDASTFTQEAGTAGAVTLTNGASFTQQEAGTVASLDATNATANVSGKVETNLKLDNAQISSSGTVEGSTTLANDSTLTQTDGTLGAVSVDASNFTQQNAGTADAVTLTNGASATLAGTVASLDATNASANVSGKVETNLKLDNAQISSSGTVEGSTTLANDSTLTQTDGTLGAVSVDASNFTQQNAGTAGKVTLTNGASATLAGTVASLDATNATANVSGKVSGDMTLTNATAEVSGTVSGDMTLTNATAEVSGTVEGSTTLANVSTLTQTAGTLGAVSVDASTFTQQNAGTAGKVTLTNNASATLAGTVASLYATNATANVSGTIKNNLTLDAAQISSSGTVEGDTTLTNVSTLTQKGGLLGAVSVDASTFTQEAAGTAGAVTLTNDASATLAGTVASLAATNATAEVSGEVVGDMTLTNATAEVSGTVSGDTTLANVSTLTQTAGTLGAVSVDASTFTQQNAGTAGAVTLTNGASATLAGTVASLDATNATANVSGTVEGAVSLDASTLTAQGDKTFASLSLKNDSTLVSTDDITVTGAITDASGSISGVNVALNGGLTGSASVTASEGLTLGGVWNVDGGSLTAGTLTIADGANVALTNSTVDGDITFADGADAELSLTESTVAGNVTLDGVNNTLNMTDSSITGTLEATAGSITFNGTNSFGNLRLDSDVNIGGVVAVDGKLEVEGGFELGKASELSTAEGLFVNDGTATLAGTVKQGDVTLTGTDENSTLSGTIETNLTLNNAQLTQTDGGEVVGSTTLTNGSTLTQTEDGTLGSVSVDASTFTQEAGTAGAVTLTNGASATLAGTVASLDATNATANVSGKVSGDVTLTETNATAEVSGTVRGDMTLTNAKANVSGTVEGSTTLANGSELTQTAGLLGAVSVDASTFTQNVGTAGAVTLTNDAFATLAGTVASLDATNASAEVSGMVSDDMTLTNAQISSSGTVEGSTTLANDSALTQTAGSLGAVSVDDSTFTQKAGTADAVTLTNGASATFAGTVASLYATNATAEVSGEVSGDMTLTNATANVSGTISGDMTLNNAQISSSGEVVGSTTLANDSALTQTAGSLGAVSVDASTFTQNAGTAGAVTLTNGSTLTQTDGSLGAVTLTNGASATLAGTVASLDATNAKANVSGTVSGDMTLTNATANVSGTVEGAVSLDASTLTAQGDKTFASLSLKNGSTLVSTDDITVTGAITDASGSISGANITVEGAITNASGSISGVNVALNGGLTGSASVTASEGLTLGGVWNVDGGSLTAGTLTIADGANVALTNSTVDGDITFADGADAELSLTESTVAGNVTLDGENNTLKVTDSSITGTLEATAGSITFNGTNSFGNLRLDSDVNIGGVVAVDGKLEVEGGFELGKASELSTAEGLFVKDGTAKLEGTVTQGDVTLTGTDENSTLSGTIETNLTLNNAQLTQTDGTVKGSTTLANGSTLTQTDGTLGAVSVDASTFTQEAAGTAGAVTLTNDAFATLAGTVASLDATNATANVSGKVSGDMTLTNTTAEVSGEVVGSTMLANGSALTQTDGTLGAVSVDASTFTQEAGTAGAVTLTNGASATLAGTVASLDATNAKANVSGTVEGSTTLANGSTLTQTAGKLGAVSVDASNFTQNAGTAGAVTLTNGASATLAGTVASLDATNTKANVSGTVSGSTTLANGSTLTQTAGKLGAVSVDASNFTQNAGTAGKVTLTNGASATLAGTVASLDATNATAEVSGEVSGDMTLTNATAEVSGTVEGAVSLDASTLKAQGDKTFASLSLKNDSTLVSTDDITVTGAITDASGSISGANIALNGGLTGSASVSASGDLTLGGTTATSGSLTAKNGTLTVADGGTLTATDAQVEAGTLAVNEGATLNLTIEEGLGDDTKLSIAGTANLTAENAMTLSNLSGAGTANKDGAGELTLSGNGAFAGTLNIGAGNASLSGAFGGSIGFASEGGTITGARGASVAGTLTLAQGTTLEIGDASGAANLTVGKIALADATTRAAGTAKVVHDVFADGTNTLMTDTLTVTDATANLSGLTAVVRSNVDEEILGVGGQTITLVEGDVAAGYGFIEGIGFDRTNAVLSEDGKSLQVMLNWKAAADGLAGSLFNDNQRAVAAATKGWNASTNKYAQALSTLSTTETAAALDDLGALHTVAMMPGQIDGTWNHQKSVLNAIGTGSQMGYQFGKPDVNMGAWVQYVGSYNDVDSSSDRLGWDRTMNGATAGFEYAVSENFLAGVALGYEYAELKSDGNKIEDDAFSVDFFAKHRSGDFEQRAALTFAHHGYDTNRTIAFGGVAESVSGDTDGFTAAIAYEAAYNFAVKEYLTLAPVATLRAALNTIDGWSESGSDAALKFDDQSAFTAFAGIGGRAEFAFANPSYPREALRLSAYALFTAEFGDRSSDVDASFVRGGNAFTMTYDDPEPYALQLGLTAFAPLTNRTALFGGISTELRDEESGFNANIGVRIGW